MTAAPERNSRNDGSTARARTLRAATTFPERLLWSRLRNGRLGYKFRRQQPIAGFIVDFFCSEAALIVEVDGRSHYGRGEDDRARQCVLERGGYRVLRVTNDDVIQRVDSVAESIKRACQNSNR